MGSMDDSTAGPHADHAPWQAPLERTAVLVVDLQEGLLRGSCTCRRKGRLVTAGHAMARVVLALVSLLFAEVATFVFDVVVGRAAALALGGAMALLVLGSLVVLPFVVGGRPPQSGT